MLATCEYTVVHCTHKHIHCPSPRPHHHQFPRLPFMVRSRRGARGGDGSGDDGGGDGLGANSKRVSGCGVVSSPSPCGSHHQTATRITKVIKMVMNVTENAGEGGQGGAREWGEEEREGEGVIRREGEGDEGNGEKFIRGIQRRGRREVMFKRSNGGGGGEEGEDGIF